MIQIKKAISKGKRYAYIRGTDIVLVKGLEGTSDQLDAAIANALRDRGIDCQSTVDGFRMDAAKCLHRGAMARARDADRAYTLSPIAIAKMMAESRDKCEMTALPFDYWMAADGRTRTMFPSLDRIDNKLGYEPGNVRVVCTCVNIALNEWGEENFENICRAFLRNLENRRMSDGKRRPVSKTTALRIMVNSPIEDAKGGR